MDNENSAIGALKEEIADLKMRWPPHSVPVSMWQRLETLEEALEKALAAEDGQKDCAGRL
jgi:hypothetical protein